MQKYNNICHVQRHTPETKLLVIIYLLKLSKADESWK